MNYFPSTMLRVSFSQLGGPFGSCAFAWLTPILPGSLEIASKRTRPCLRLCLLSWAELYAGASKCQGGKITPSNSKSKKGGKNMVS